MSDQVPARLKPNLEALPVRRLLVLPCVIGLHICFFGALFGAHSGLINISGPKFRIVGVDIVSASTKQGTVLELDIDTRIPVKPPLDNPKKPETVKKETEAQPEHMAREKEVVEKLTTRSVQSPTPEPATNTESLHDLEAINLASLTNPLPQGDSNSFGIDLRTGLDSIVLDCLEYLEFSEKAQTCFQPKPEAPPQTVPVNEICLVKIDIMVDGTVENLIAKDCPYPEFLEITRIAVKNWRFVPAVVNGKKVIDRRRDVKIFICEDDLKNISTYADSCALKSPAAGDFLNKPIALGKPRPLDKKAIKENNHLKEILAQPRPLQDDMQASPETPPKKKLSLEDILK